MPTAKPRHRFEIIDESTVVHVPAAAPSSCAIVGPRCVVAPDGSGDVICTYMRQSRLGINDFTPMITRSNASFRAWSEPRPLWPQHIDRYALFCHLSRSADDLYVFGSRSVLDAPGEPCWSDENLGLKANQLMWAHSGDDGQTWSEPRVTPWPYPGTAEAAGPMLITRPTGRWIGVYSPYNIMNDTATQVQRERVVAVVSDDQGATWGPNVMIQFDEADTGGAEAWVTQLTDGRLLGVTWHVDMSGANRNFANRYAISHDEGATWRPARSTGIIANTTALTPLDDNRALFITVRRGKDDAGIWLSIVRPTDEDFGIESDQCIWSSRTPTQDGGEATHENWTEFTYGEPGVAALPDGTFLLVFWYLDATGAGVRYLHLRLLGDHA